MNFVKHHLTDVNVSDTWDDNNEYIEGSMRIFELSSAEPWVGIREIPLSEVNVQFYKNGFKFSIPDVQNIISVEYKTRLKNKLQNPVNVLSFTAMGQEYSFEREITVANATGAAKGKVRPFTYDVPPAPVHELPELDVPDVPKEEPKTPPTQEELPPANAEVKSQGKKVLPKTGSKDNIMYLVIGAFVGLIASLLLPLSKRK